MLFDNTGYFINRPKVLNIIACQVLRFVVYVYITNDPVTGRFRPGIQIIDDPDSPAITPDDQCVKTDQPTLYFRYSQ